MKIISSIYVSQGEKNVQPDRGPNPGPPLTMASAPPTEPPGRLTHTLPYRDLVRTVTHELKSNKTNRFP